MFGDNYKRVFLEPELEFAIRIYKIGSEKLKKEVMTRRIAKALSWQIRVTKQENHFIKNLNGERQSTHFLGASIILGIGYLSGWYTVSPQEKVAPCLSLPCFSSLLLHPISFNKLLCHLRHDSRNPGDRNQNSAAFESMFRLEQRHLPPLLREAPQE